MWQVKCMQTEQILASQNTLKSLITLAAMKKVFQHLSPSVFALYLFKEKMYAIHAFRHIQSVAVDTNIR